MSKLAPVPLWPDGAPGAQGQTALHQPRLTPYLPQAGTKPRGCIVVCPGGGYGGLAPHETEPIAQWLCAAGLAACVLEYRVAPYRHPIPLGDAQRALRLVRHRAADWRIDPRRVGILGFSAGGHLAASAATLFQETQLNPTDPVDRQSSRPDAFIGCYPVITFGEQRHHGSMINLLGDPPKPALREQLSLEHRVTKDTPPSFLWHTADDQAVPVENSLLFAQALRRCSVPFALHIFPSGRHGLGLAQGDPVVGMWPSLCTQWLASMGFVS